MEEHEEIIVKVNGDTKEDLISATSWEELGLPEALVKGIYAKGFATPAKIQAVALPIVLRSTNHIIAQAKNGSGKTATFSVAAICRALESKTGSDRKSKEISAFSGGARLEGISVLVLSPSRELAKQNQDVIDELAKFTDIKTYLACPSCQGVPRDVNIVSGTPGKVRDLVLSRQLNLANIQMFVLDEADVMIDEGDSKGAQVIEITRKIIQVNPNCQLLLFSATFPPRTTKYAQSLAKNAHMITLRKEELTLSTTQQFYMRLSEGTGIEEKIKVLFDLYSSMTIGQSVIFIATRETAKRVAEAMTENGYSVGLICGGKDDGTIYAKREKRMAEFRKGVTKVMVTTDLLSRGIDVPSVTLVINFDLPMSYKLKGSIEYVSRFYHLLKLPSLGDLPSPCRSHRPFRTKRRGYQLREK